MLAEEIRWAAGRVLLAPQRLAFLLRGGLDDMFDLRRFLAEIVPPARASIARLERFAERIPDVQLRAQAISSLTAKGYHIAGAAILATFLPSMAREHYIQIVAPLEAIYDFLDSLCDRHPQTPESAYHQLHEALGDALDPARPLHHYYLHGPPGDDGDYLHILVRRVRRALARLAGYEELIPYFRDAVTLYADAQTYKHLPPGERERACIAWYERENARFADLSWWELGAAAGSQFHVYAALYAAFCSEFDRIEQTYNAYFPSLAALHVLLDSFIDQAEDRAHGELNWVECYPSREAFVTRMHVLAQRSREGFRHLSMPRAHMFALRIMSLFYLTHPKIDRQALDDEALELLRALS